MRPSQGFVLGVACAAIVGLGCENDDSDRAQRSMTEEYAPSIHSDYPTARDRAAEAPAYAGGYRDDDYSEATVRAGSARRGERSAMPSPHADVRRNGGMAARDDESVYFALAGSLTGFDREFALEAASGGHYEVESSQLALEKSENADHREIARMMIEDHTKANDELAALAQRKGLVLPYGMQPKHREMIQTLEDLDAEMFDARFRQDQIQAHRETIALFERATREARDPDLRAFAERTLPTLRKHLAHLEGHMEMPPGDAPAANRDATRDDENHVPADNADAWRR